MNRIAKMFQRYDERRGRATSEHAGPPYATAATQLAAPGAPGA